MLGEIEGRRRKGATEDEMVGWHHRLNGHEFEQALGDGEGQGSLVCYSPWGCKEPDTTELNRTELSPVLSSSEGEESACSEGDLGLILGLGRSPGGGHGNHSSILAWKIPTERGAWRVTVHRVAKSQI